MGLLDEIRLFLGEDWSRTQSLRSGWEDPLEKEMAPQSSISAWEITQTEDPGRLQSVGSQRLGYDLVSK